MLGAWPDLHCCRFPGGAQSFGPPYSWETRCRSFFSSLVAVLGQLWRCTTSGLTRLNTRLVSLASAREVAGTGRASLAFAAEWRVEGAIKEFTRRDPFFVDSREALAPVIARRRLNRLIVVCSVDNIKPVGVLFPSCKLLTCASTSADVNLNGSKGNFQVHAHS